MFPRLGRVHVCAFSDEGLYGEVAQKSSFFQNTEFYGVDLSALHAPATAGYFGQVGPQVPAQLPRCAVLCCAVLCCAGCLLGVPLGCAVWHCRSCACCCAVHAPVPCLVT